MRKIFVQTFSTDTDISCYLWFQNKRADEVQTCCVHNAICTDCSMWSLDVPPAIGGWVEGGDWSRVVNVGAVHPSPSRQSHGQGVRVDVSVSWGEQACQHLKEYRTTTCLQSILLYSVG